MKLLLGLCLVICFVGIHCDTDTFNLQDPRLSECITESKVDTQLLKDVKEKMIIANTRELQCFLACMMKKDKMMNADGTLTKEFLEAKDTEGCKNEGGKDACETGFKTMMCLIKAQPIEGSTNFKYNPLKIHI